jgi:hypothetical protein
MKFENLLVSIVYWMLVVVCVYFQKLAMAAIWINYAQTLQEITTFQKANLTKMFTLTKGYVHFD